MIIVVIIDMWRDAVGASPPFPADTFVRKQLNRTREYNNLYHTCREKAAI